MLKKRGQITAFILIGILIVVSAISIYYTKDYILKSKWEREREKSLLIPEQAKVVYSYISSCIKDVGEKAVRLTGQQGGYTEIPGDPVQISELNPFSNALTVFPDLKVPYWYYETANNLQKTQMPTLEGIESSISGYIDENLKTCLNNFRDLEGYKITSSDIKTETKIYNDNVRFTVIFPVHIELGDFRFDIESFYEKMDTALGELYYIAKNTFEKENNERFLEKKTLDMMIINEEIPYSGSTTDCVAPFWVKGDVIDNFKTILFHNIQFIKLKGTNYVLASKEHDYYEWEVGAVDKSIDANFLFSERWPFSLEISPGDEILKATSVTENLGQVRGIAESFFCFSNYHFIYDIKYPVLVVLSKEGYTFQFALQVIIDNNEPRKTEILAESVVDIDRRHCKNRQNYVSVYTYDGLKPLDNVNIKYLCINHLCDVGSTKLDEFGYAYLKEKFPVCFNGVLIANKPGYHQARSVVSTNKETAITINLERYKELNTEVVIERAGSGEVREGETVLIRLNEEDKGYSESIIYPEQKRMKLIPGNYKISLYLISDYPEGIHVEGREVEKCVDVPKKGVTGLFGATEKKCTKIEIPGFDLDRVISGAAEFELKVTDYDLKEKVTFYIPYQGKPRTIEDLSKISSEVKEDFTYPEFE